MSVHEELNPTTPFCLGCGAWIFERPEIDDSPFYDCQPCAELKLEKIKIMKQNRRYPK